MTADLHAPLEPGWWQPPDGDPSTIDWPYRLVDRNWIDWVHIGQGRYQAAYSAQLPTSTYLEIDTDHGPLRHLTRMPDGDWETLVTAMLAVKHKAIGSMLVALWQLCYRHRENIRVLIAGRSGSWESDGMIRIGTLVGSDLARRPSHYDDTAVQLFVDTITRWTHGYPRFYVEVAESLNGIVGDAIERAGGWNNLCQRSMRRGTMIPYRYAELAQTHFDGMHEYRQHLDQDAARNTIPQEMPDDAPYDLSPVFMTPLRRLSDDLLVHAAESQPADIRPFGPEVLCLATDTSGGICNLPAGHLDERTGQPSAWHAEVLADGSTWGEWRGAPAHMPCYVPPEHPIRQQFQRRRDADAEV